MSRKSVKFGSFLKRYMDDRSKFRRWLKLGLGMENFRRKYLADRDKPEFLRIINQLSLEEVYFSLKGKSTVWVNLLAPSELLIPLKLNPVSAEGVSGMLSSMHIEGIALMEAAGQGVPDSLCTFHRASLGVSMKQLLPAPAFVMTTSILCDGNLPTFKRIATEYKTPFLFIDVPRGHLRSSVSYVLSQLEETVKAIEEITGRRYPMNDLSEVLQIERNTVESLQNARKHMNNRFLPQELFEIMNSLYVMHTLAGDRRLYEASRRLEEGLVTVPDGRKKVLWLHIPPYYDNELFSLFSKDTTNVVVGNEMMWDWLYPVDPERPLESLAEKLVFNPLCGSVTDRGKLCLELADDLEVDGVIHFSHWGCRQSAGGVSYLKRLFEGKGLPFLELTGDCVDHTSEGAGQLRTRVQAFLEIMEKSS